jgi:hypothetical protein
LEGFTEASGLSLDLNTIQQGLGILVSVLTILGGLLAALWAYTRFVLERGLFPSTQFSINCNIVGRHEGETVLEILLLLKNVGYSTLIAKDIKVDIRCLDTGEKPKLYDNVKDTKFGRLFFPLSLKQTLMKRHQSGAMISAQESTAGSATGKTPSYMPVLPDNTFVQAGVEQTYTFVTAVPQSIVFVLVRASFEYESRSSPFHESVLGLSRRIGLVQFTLGRTKKPHTAERVFRVSGAEIDNTL